MDFNYSQLTERYERNDSKFNDRRTLWYVLWFYYLVDILLLFKVGESKVFLIPYLHYI